MKKLFFLIILLIALSTENAISQCIDNFPILTTDHVVNTQKNFGISGKVNYWDWTRDFYSNDVWVTDNKYGGPDNICNNIPAPWYNSTQQLNNPNISHLVYDLLFNKLDVYPADGWELLTKNMGKEIIVAGEVRPEPVSNPSYSIYNRRTGHIKVFMYITSTTLQSPQSVKIRLQYTRNQYNSPIEGGLINHRDSIVLTLEKFKIGDIQDVHASYDGIPRTGVACFQEGLWIMGDFWVNLDPCSCYPDYAAQVEFEFEFKQQQEIQMKIDGDLSGSIVSTKYGGTKYLENNSLKNSAFNGLLNEKTFGNILDLQDGVVKAYKGAQGFNEFAMAMVKPKVAGGVPLLKGSLAVKLAAKGSVFGPKGMLVMGAIGLTNSFIKMNKKSKVDQPKPLVFESNFKMNLNALGTITNIPQKININLLVPGSPNQPAGAASKPIYNNVLGVFRVTELPKLQFVQWQLPLFNHFLDGTLINQYKLESKPIKYIVNPASGLTIESIQSQIVIKLNKRNLPTPFHSNLPPAWNNYDMRYRPPYTGVFQFGDNRVNLQFCEGVNDFEKQYTASGLQITNWLTDATRYEDVTVATPFIDLPCVHNQTFAMDFEETFNAYIKFHIVFNVSNKFGAITDGTGEGGSPTNETEQVEYIVTYPLEIEA
ncbi:MAG: hypothetical protein MH472_14045, partial [Bacteroidia bacterium]|nr:hypothetical protein [Bacteroidia bacterium]